MHPERDPPVVVVSRLDDGTGFLRVVPEREELPGIVFVVGVEAACGWLVAKQVRRPLVDGSDSLEELTLIGHSPRVGD